MRHVTDGELHAYLDGALDLLPQDRGEEVRNHIASCPACSERLQDEEHLRSQAERVLRSPDLGEVALPTFEELRERAEAPGVDPLLQKTESNSGIHYRGPMKGLPLAWAATIVLALGVGWMGGQVWRTLPGGRVSSLAPGEQSPAQIANRDVDSPGAGDFQPVRSESRQDLSAAATPSVAEEEVGELPPSVTLPGGVRDAQRRTAAQAPVAAPPSPDLNLLESRQADSMTVLGERPRIIDSAASANSAIALEELVVTGAPVSPKPARALASTITALEEAGVPGASISAARFKADSVGFLGVNTDSEENSLAVRGFRVVSIEWEERVVGEKALLIRQLLSPGDTLELRYLGMLLGTDADPLGRGEGGIPKEEAPGGRVYANILEASLAPGWNQVVMELGRSLLVARAPIPEADLKALLKTLHQR